MFKLFAFIIMNPFENETGHLKGLSGDKMIINDKLLLFFVK